MALDAKNAHRLREEIIRLGPWHYEIEVADEVSTRVHLDAPQETHATVARMSFLDAKEPFQRKLRLLYPEGLQGRSILDCACNCGVYLFWAKELGAGRCFGSDVRELWIDQARFLLENRTVGTSEEIQFEVRDLYELPRLGLEPFDITLFQGILYHLPDVVRGLKVAADLTRELIIVNTSTWNDAPDGFLALGTESVTAPLSGVYGLNWFPTGPKVVATMLAWLGFPEGRLVFWRRDTDNGPRHLGRIEIIAAREAETLAAWDHENRNLLERCTNLLDLRHP